MGRTDRSSSKIEIPVPLKTSQKDKIDPKRIACTLRFPAISQELNSIPIPNAKNISFQFQHRHVPKKMFPLK
jgi:hypothetical protein